MDADKPEPATFIGSELAKSAHFSPGGSSSHGRGRGIDTTLTRAREGEKGGMDRAFRALPTKKSVGNVRGSAVFSAVNWENVSD